MYRYPCIGNLKQSQTKQNYDENLILMESLCGNLFCIICIYTIVLAFLSAKQIHSKVAYTRSVLPSCSVMIVDTMPTNFFFAFFFNQELCDYFLQ